MPTRQTSVAHAEIPSSVFRRQRSQELERVQSTAGRGSAADLAGVQEHLSLCDALAIGTERGTRARPIAPAELREAPAGRGIPQDRRAVGANSNDRWPLGMERDVKTKSSCSGVRRLRPVVTSRGARCCRNRPCKPLPVVAELHVGSIRREPTLHGTSGAAGRPAH